MKHAIEHIHFVGIGGSGMNGIAEGVRQVRGSSANQVNDVHNVVVTAGTGVPTSGLILGDRA